MKKLKWMLDIELILLVENKLIVELKAVENHSQMFI